MQKTRKITETLANRYSSESTQRELSNEYQDDRVSMVFHESCILVLWTKVGLTPGLPRDIADNSQISNNFNNILLLEPFWGTTSMNRF